MEHNKQTVTFFSVSLSSAFFPRAQEQVLPVFFSPPQLLFKKWQLTVLIIAFKRRQAVLLSRRVDLAVSKDGHILLNAKNSPENLCHSRDPSVAGIFIVLSPGINPRLLSYGRSQHLIAAGLWRNPKWISKKIIVLGVGLKKGDWCRGTVQSERGPEKHLWLLMW